MAGVRELEGGGARGKIGLAPHFFAALPARGPAYAPVAVAAAHSLVQPHAAAQDLVLENRCSSKVDVLSLGDEHRVRQILANLLSNAVKFTPAGG